MAGRAHEQVAALLAELAASGRPSSMDLPLDEGRRNFAEILVPLGATADVEEVRDLLVPGPSGHVPVRSYRPASGGGEALPAVLYFHGGGWVFGSIDTHDGICRLLANAAGALVLSVGYRRPPEHPFPAALDDCFAATGWVAANAGDLGADPTRLAVAGESAGANLAAAVALRARDAGGPPIAFQLLLFPCLDPTLSSPSMQEFADDPFLSRDEMVWYWDRYLASPEAAADPYAAPSVAEDLTGLPPALVITAEVDTLRDEGERYAERLAGAGVPVTLSRYDGMIHGFFVMGAYLDDGMRAVEEAGAALRGSLGGPVG